MRHSPFLKRCWVKDTDLLAEIEVSGKRKKGKPKLTQDEAHQLAAWCFDHPGAGSSRPGFAAARPYMTAPRG
jgi:hypothetical protein